MTFAFKRRSETATWTHCAKIASSDKSAPRSRRSVCGERTIKTRISQGNCRILSGKKTVTSSSFATTGFDFCLFKTRTAEPSCRQCALNLTSQIRSFVFVLNQRENHQKNSREDPGRQPTRPEGKRSQAVSRHSPKLQGASISCRSEKDSDPKE